MQSEKESRRRQPAASTDTNTIIIPDFAAMSKQFQDAVDPTALERFATRLDVSAESLRKLRIGRDGDAWTFPEQDSDGRIIGISRRPDHGTKHMVEGSKRGLTMPLPLDRYAGSSLDKPMLIVEGATDAAAALDLGYDVIARPSATGGLEYLQRLLQDPHVVIVGENDSGAGRAGATKMADGLMGIAASVRIVFPPDGVKDLRAWKSHMVDGELAAAIHGAGQHQPTEDDSAHLANESWEQPAPLHSEGKPPTFPLGEALPPALDPIRDYLAAVAESVQVPVDLPAMMLLSVASLALAQKVEVQTAQGHTEPAAIFTVTLLPSANRKSAVITIMIRPLQYWEQDEAKRLGPIIAEQQEALRIDEQRLVELRKKAAKAKPDEAVAMRKAATELAQQLAGESIEAIPQLITMEPTTEAVAALLVHNHERLLVASAEADSLDVMLGRYSRGTPNFGVYLCGHSGDAYRIDRRGREPDHLKRPTLSMGLIIQPDAVMDLFNNRQAHGRGFIARFLKSVPTGLLGRRKIDPDPIPRALAETYEQTILQLLDEPIPDEPTIIELSPDAAAPFRDFQAWIEPELGDDGELRDHREWAGKLVGAIGRIALVLHGLQWGLGVHSRDAIDQETMAAALAWAPYLIDHERIAAGLIGTNDTTVIAERVLRWLGQQPEAEKFSHRDAFNACRSQLVKKTDDIDTALELLEEMGYIRPITLATQSRSGRKPSPKYAVNPLWREKAKA